MHVYINIDMNLLNAHILRFNIRIHSRYFMKYKNCNITDWKLINGIIQCSLYFVNIPKVFVDGVIFIPYLGLSIIFISCIVHRVLESYPIYS